MLITILIRFIGLVDESFGKENADPYKVRI